MISIDFNKDLPFSIFSFLHWDEHGRERLSVLVKGSFLLDQNGRFVAAREKPDILFEDQFSGEVNASSLKMESDIAPFKPKTDISFNAIARSPEAKALTSWPVRFEITDNENKLLSYNFHVTGQRFFEPKKNGEKGQKYWELGEMAKTSSVPINYEHSFGGTIKISEEEVKTHPYNPVGRGLVSDYLLEQDVKVAIAQIGILAELNEPKPDQEMTVCGIAPLVKSWLPRQALAGTFDENWFGQRHPRMPEDFNFHYWNSAPLPLQIAPYLRGDEVLRLSGLSHDPRPLILTLPGAGIGARVFRHGSMQAQALRLQLDTIHGDIGSENREDHRFTLIWRAVIDEPDDIAEIILHPAALPSLSTDLGNGEESLAHKTSENKEARDILQSRRRGIEAGSNRMDAQGGSAASVAALSMLASDAMPLFSVMLISGAKADFYEQEDKILVTQSGTLETIHIGSKGFIYAQADGHSGSLSNPDNPSHTLQKIDERVILYVRLMNEEVLVWRPVIAHWHGDLRFYISLQNVPPGEIWEFRPDRRVVAEWRHFNGNDYLVATALSDY